MQIWHLNNGERADRKKRSAVLYFKQFPHYKNRASYYTAWRIFFFKSREKLTGHRIGTWWGKVMKQEKERDLLGALRWEGGTGKVYPCLDQFQGIVFHLIFNLKRCLELGLCINKSSWNFLENPSSALENVFAFIRYKENLNTKMFQQQIDLVKLSVTWVMSKILSGEWYR